MIRLGIDLMGGDRPPKQLFQAANSHALEGVQLIYFVHPSEKPDHPKSTFHLSDEVITMQDDPIRSVLKKPNASLVQGLSQLAKGEIDAFITSGNTGALIAGATKYLTKMKTMDRLGLLATLPSLKGEFTILDVGGTVTFKPEHLLQFAKFASSYHQKERPTVGLLNIGVESLKGSAERQKAFHLLQKETSFFEFVGNVEPNSLFEEGPDIVVSDGFSGNVLIKTCEGISSLIFKELPKDEAIQAVEKKFSSAEYPGALLSGTRELVIKCHGNASDEALVNSIHHIAYLAGTNTLASIESMMADAAT